MGLPCVPQNIPYLRHHWGTWGRGSRCRRRHPCSSAAQFCCVCTVGHCCSAWLLSRGLGEKVENSVPWTSYASSLGYTLGSSHRGASDKPETSFAKWPLHCTTLGGHWSFHRCQRFVGLILTVFWQEPCRVSRKDYLSLICMKAVFHPFGLEVGYNGRTTGLTLWWRYTKKHHYRD